MRTEITNVHQRLPATMSYVTHKTVNLFVAILGQSVDKFHLRKVKTRQQRDPLCEIETARNAELFRPNKARSDDIRFRAVVDLMKLRQVTGAAIGAGGEFANGPYLVRTKP
jgi:hypothetical protein